MVTKIFVVSPFSKLRSILGTLYFCTPSVPVPYVKGEYRYLSRVSIFCALCKRKLLLGLKMDRKLVLHFAIHPQIVQLCRILFSVLKRIFSRDEPGRDFVGYRYSKIEMKRTILSWHLMADRSVPTCITRWRVLWSIAQA